MVSIIRKQLGAYKYQFLSALARRLMKYDVNLGLQTPDRALLENKILPFFASNEAYKDILFVGCEWYTRKYNTLFEEQNYITMEMNPDLASYGSKNHIIDQIEHIDQHFKGESLDLVVCNGVYGWGLDERAAIETAFGGIYDSLKPGGIFLLGWNDADGHRPVPLQSLENLKRFKSWYFKPLETDSLLANIKTGHRYHFYQK